VFEVAYSCKLFNPVAAGGTKWGSQTVKRNTHNVSMTNCTKTHFELIRAYEMLQVESNVGNVEKKTLYLGLKSQ